MQFITALFGGTDSTVLNAAFALGIVLVLIVLAVWVLKLFTNASTNVVRRNKRLSVIDSASVDAKRKVLIIRRDNVEHVIMTGGPQDLVIESGVPVPAPEPAPPRRAATPRRPAQPQPNASKPAPAAAPDIATPAPPVLHRVPREAIDRLRDLARPAPLKPRDHMRQGSLLRSTERPEPPLIPTGPQLRVDNSGGAKSDSAKTATGDGTDGRPRIVGRNRFFRSASRDRS